MLELQRLQAKGQERKEMEWEKGKREPKGEIEEEWHIMSFN